MYLIKRILIIVFIVISANTAYSQKKECDYYSYRLADFVKNNFSKGFLNDTTIYFFIDSNVVKGLTTTYADSIRVDISFKSNYIFVHDYGFFESDGYLYKIHYPIALKNNSLFKKAIYYGDCSLTSYIVQGLYSQQKEGEKKRYCILSSDGKYTNYAFLEEKDGDLYTKYDPFNKDNSGTVMTMKWKKLDNWLTQKFEMNKNKLISVIKNGKVYTVKLFND